MAQTQRFSGFSTPNYIGKPEQQASGPRLPPIHTIPASQAAYPENRGQVQLPPMHVSPTTAPQRYDTNSTIRRSIPVAQLLTTDSPSPPKVHSSHLAQPAKDLRQSSEQHFKSPFQYYAQPSPHQPVPYHFEQPSMTFRQPQQVQQIRPSLPGESYSHHPHMRYPQQPLPESRQSEQMQHHMSPTVSTYSSSSYAHSEASPRSSMGPQPHAGLASRPRPSALPPLDFILNIRQQPAAARACGFGERDRRVIDPPPILELKITDQSTGFPASDPAGMLALNCSLLSADGRDDETELPATHPDMRSTQRLMGTLVASPYQAKDEHGNAGTFFVFPDLSCRSPGKYRLRFKLLRVEPMNMASGGRSVAQIVTETFNVYTAKDFPGMRASSGLLKALRKQGLNVGVKKGSEARKTKGKTKKEDSSASEDEDDTDDDGGSSSGVSPKTRARKKGKRRREA